MRHQRRLRKLLNSEESKKCQVTGCSRADRIANAKLSILVSGGHRRVSRRAEVGMVDECLSQARRRSGAERGTTILG